MTGYEPTVWVDNAASPRLNAEALNKIEQGIAAAGSQDSPTFTGNVTLPATTTIGTVSSVELGYLDGVTSGIQGQLNAKAPLASPALTGTPTAPTAAAGTNTTQIASTAYVRTEVANIVNSAPATLDTLNEIAAALGSDPNFATTMTNLINTKAPSASPTFTGTVVLPGTTSIGNVSSTEIGYLDGVTSAIQTQISGKANSSHAHAISDVTNLQTSLDAKVDEVASTDNAIVRFNGAGGAVQNSSATLADDGSITATYFNATSNAAGTNYKVGDDAWIGDVNWANTIRITGVTEPANGYLIFGNGDSTALGRAGTGALTYGGNTIWHAGNDGSGSGLDADLLDGNHASAFALSSHTHTIANITSLQTTLDAKAPLASPSFTGTVTMPNVSITQADSVFYTTVYLPSDLSNLVLGSAVGSGDRIRLHRSGVNGYVDYTGSLNFRPDGVGGTLTLTSTGATLAGTISLPSTTSIGSVDSTELGYLNGVTSAIQTQLNAKVDEVASTDNAVVRFNGTGGSVQNSGVIVDDSNNVSIPGALTLNGKPAGRVHVQSTAPSSPANGDLWVDTSTPTWIAPTLLNSWANYGGGYNNAGYMKDALGFVHLRGLIKNGNIATIFNLPSGYRPVGQCLFFAPCNHTPTPPVSARIDIIPSTGAVDLVSYETLGNNAWVSLDGIMFATF